MTALVAFEPIVEHLIEEGGCQGYTVVVDDRLDDDDEGAWRQDETSLPGYLRWRLFQIEGVQITPTPPPGDPGYMYGEEIDWRKADWEVEGTVKWDGCCNWQTSPKCMVHSCDPEAMQRLFDATKRAVAICYEQMKVEG